MKRGFRRLIIVAAALTGLVVVYRENAGTQSAYSSCLQRAGSMEAQFGCDSPDRTDQSECLRKAEASRKSMTESCHQIFSGSSGRNYLRNAVIYGCLAFVGVALLLELIRFIVACVISGFRS